ncbi:CHC2 zinc finger domain-containing protein [Janthinobacterium lividum]|uniref:CHC2 zinc finger domain-containing protein n=1 Tax=Janthinobacterium lividum TaxID=29581 RepID=UPI0015880D5B|nr:CHC2 zinc finger domain-containing protein [Janthinobacterium lividum]
MPRIDYERLLQNTSIEDVARRIGMELTRTSATQSKALCPFHDDKTPSLLIDSSRDKGHQHFYCFACGAHGDAIDLVKEQLQLGFKEAVSWLEPGVFSSSSGAPRQKRVKARESSTLSKSGLSLGYQLYLNGSKGEELAAWANKRNLDLTVLLRAGFAYAAKNFLSRTLDAENDGSIRREESGLLEDANLVRQLFPGLSNELHLPLDALTNAKKRYSDFFIEERIVFPLYSERKELLGIGGRAVQESHGSSAPKYQFTKGFPKSTVLYRAEFAFGHVRKAAIEGAKEVSLYLCEGFLDALRFESLGLPAVAVMGAAVSDHQIRLLHALSDELPKDVMLIVVVAFDCDEAGLRGAADASLKLLNAPIECRFLWPTAPQLSNLGRGTSNRKDPNDYLQGLSVEEATKLIEEAIYLPELALLANEFSVSADDVLNSETWESSTRSRRARAFVRALAKLKKLMRSGMEEYLARTLSRSVENSGIAPLEEWAAFLVQLKQDSDRLVSEEFLNDSRARLNHSRILAYMGSRRGELPCNEPRWERLDVAATAFNALLVDRLASIQEKGPIGPYDAVWVSRAFGGEEFRLKMMPRPEDLIIQQYLLNEMLTERWDHMAYTGASFSKTIPAVRYYREDRRTVTTGFDSKGDGTWEEVHSRTLSFAYQIDMDVLEGRQPATDQGMYRPFHECWRDFMKSLSNQAAEIGYVYSIRLDVKRYYDRIRRYVVRDSLQRKLQTSIESVSENTPGFAEWLSFQGKEPDAASRAAAILDHIDEHLFGVSYSRPDNGLTQESDPLIGIPQGPVLSAWIGTIALFPIDEEAYRFMERLNTDRVRVGYARYVDDIVILADDPDTLEEMREAFDRLAGRLELSLLAKADEIPAMSAEDFTTYINQGRALAASGPAWEPPLVGDGETGWDFWSVGAATDRQSALQLLHNVELYKASQSVLLQTVRTAFQAADLRASELPKAARLVWYSVAVEHYGRELPVEPSRVWAQYLEAWSDCLKGAPWRLQPELNQWESPVVFALEGLEHLIDKGARDIPELSSEENFLRRGRILWLVDWVLKAEIEFYISDSAPGPDRQVRERLSLVRWKAKWVAGTKNISSVRHRIEQASTTKNWLPFEWMHDAVILLSEIEKNEQDPLIIFIGPTIDQTRRNIMCGPAADIFRALLPDQDTKTEIFGSDSLPNPSKTALGLALQTIISIVPKKHLPICLSRRQRLIWRSKSDVTLNSLPLPPLPGIQTSRIYSALGSVADGTGSSIVNAFEAIDFDPNGDANYRPVFFGSNGQDIRVLSLNWQSSVIDMGGELLRLDATLAPDEYLNLRERIQTIGKDLTSNDLKTAARLFRAISQVVVNYSDATEDRELVPAWPYIGLTENEEFFFLIGDMVSRSELGNRAFIKDGGRALRTIEVPTYEANLWRVGVAISEYLGFGDDITKFSDADGDVTLDANALANPARYILRAQLRKLRGAYADSQISKRRDDKSQLPATVERSLHLLETFPNSSENALDPVLYVLAAEAESAAMYLAFRERWQSKDISSFLISLTERALSRLPLAVAQSLATSLVDGDALRRDFAGLLCFARRLFSVPADSTIVALPAWLALRAGLVSTAISVSLQGVVSSLRSHGKFERYSNFDFPSEWGIPPATSLSEYTENIAAIGDERLSKRVPLLEQLRGIVQRLGHRLRPTNLEDETTQWATTDSAILDVAQVSKQLFCKLRSFAIEIAQIESHSIDDEVALEWPFDLVSADCLDLLSLELLESTAELVELLDRELNFETLLVVEKAFGYNAQTRRFTDSRNGVRDVTPWMITQFPRNSKRIEEISDDGSFLRVWTEVFDRTNGKLLSVSALGEPFASIAVDKPKINADSSVNASGEDVLGESRQIRLEKSEQVGVVPAILPHASDKDFVPSNIHSENIQREQERAVLDDVTELPLRKTAKLLGSLEQRLLREVSDFRRQQAGRWSLRGKSRRPGHIRIALLQADFDLTYKHPLVEACPTNWPFCTKVRDAVSQHLMGNDKSREKYHTLLSAGGKAGGAYLWSGIEGKTAQLPSWSEHRRQAILSRVIDSCDEFGVDLLVLPEYSVRRETIEWLKTFLQNKSVSVLAGTFMEVQKDPSTNHLAAPLTLLWPLPQEVKNQYIASLKKSNLGSDKDYDSLNRGHVLEFSRNKKYRSIALDEFFRPSKSTLTALFRPEALAKALEKKVGFEPSAEVLSLLLAGSRLPLKYLLELICSEIFLVSSPANYRHMHDDLDAMLGRFGEKAEADVVFTDVKTLSDQLSITGDGKGARRSILAVPAATSRSADYWIAGQAGYLAAGTATVFCNSIDGKTIVGGSCFIGCGSWKSEDSALGYIARITPYHGWSKGIFYNNGQDALSKRDQAVVIVDIDPHNMLEGKPRAQTMPSPLQLVAYLPLLESVDWVTTEASLLRALSIPDGVINVTRGENKTRPRDEESFWQTFVKAKETPDEDSLAAFWKKFPDSEALESRAKAFQDNGEMQPTAHTSDGSILSTPAFYDWLDVSLTLTEQQALPTVAVPPWKKPAL